MAAQAIAGELAGADAATIGVTRQGRRWMLCFAIGAVGLLVAVPLVYLLVASGPVKVRAFAAGLLGALAALAALPLGVLARAFVSQRIGIREDAGDSTLRYERAGRVVAAAPLEQCRTDGKRLLIDGHAVLLHRFAPIFDAELVRSQLLARLPPSQWISPLRFELELWRRMVYRHRGTLISLLVAVVLLCAVASISRQSWQALAKWIGALAGMG